MKINIKFSISITLTVLLLSGMRVMSQNPANMVMPQIPPSPQAVAFNRLGEYQVNNNYGAPDINIPLWEIDFHGYKIPLSLHYEANPLKPGYCYDVTGIGWTLSGNSCVSRTIKDRADELPGPFEIASFTLDSFTDKQGYPRKYKNEKDGLHKLNFQYDTYNIVLPSGRSIPFFMYVQKGSNENKPKFDLLSHDQNVIIKCQISNINKRNASIDSFIVTDENGITYHFTEADKTPNSYTNDLNADRNVTWLLTRIDLPNKGSITYNYCQDKVKTHAQNLVSEPVTRVHRVVYQNRKIDEVLSHEDFSGSYSPEKFRVTQTTQNQCPAYEMKFLASISYDSTVVNFNYADDKKHMKEIVVSDYNTSTKKYDIIRKFTLSVNGRECPGFFLNSIVISDQNDTDKLVYGFEYYNNLNLGNYTDYWGNRCRSNNEQDIGNFNLFVNIKEDGSYLSRIDDFQKKLNGKKFAQLCEEKETDPYYYYKIKLQSTLDGDSRKSAQPNEHGILTKIIYPNGGYTMFNWENHRFLTATAEDGDFVYDRRKQRIIEGGGFRIKSVINFTVDNKIASQDHYRYGYTYGEIKQTNFPLPLPKQYDANKYIGCGEPVVDPNILTFMDYSLYDCDGPEFLKMIVGLDSELKNAVNIQSTPILWDADFSANTFRALLGGRRPVVYPEITVYHGDPEKTESCKSKTVYKYDIYDYAMDNNKYYLTSIFQSGKGSQNVQLDTAYFEPIRYNSIGSAPLPTCDEIPYKRHQLKSMSNYSYNGKSWNLVSEEENDYGDWSAPITKSGYRFNSNISREWESFFDNSMYINDYRNPRSEQCYISHFYEQTWQGLGAPARLTKKTTTVYRQGGSPYGNTMTEEYKYLYSGVIKSQESTSPNEGYKFDWYSYVGEGDDSNSVLKEMKKRNILASPTSVETISYIVDHDVEIGSKIDYAFYPTTTGLTNILPSKLYESNGMDENDKIIYEPSVEVKSYDDFGNPTEIMDLKTGVHSVFLWDKLGRYMTTMIKNAKLADVDATVSGNSLSRYKSLKTMLPNSQIETWDYKTLIGVSAHTDVSGQTFVYEYDGLGRLKSEKRMVVINNKTTYETIHEYEYNYKNGME